MNLFVKSLAFSLISLFLAGCSNGLFGGRVDDTVLPGKREDALPKRSATEQDVVFAPVETAAPDKNAQTKIKNKSSKRRRR